MYLFKGIFGTIPRRNTQMVLPMAGAMVFANWLLGLDHGSQSYVDFDQNPEPTSDDDVPARTRSAPDPERRCNSYLIGDHRKRCMNAKEYRRRYCFAH